MKRFTLRLGAVLLAIGGIVGSHVDSTLARNVDAFTISSFTADYYLSKDGEGRSNLKTVEKIVAEFPVYDQNHGLERALPQKYDGHSTNLRIESVKDVLGKTLSYSESESNDNLVLRIGDADTYVHGRQTYEIIYMQRDATKFFADTNDDEFYWDVNGAQWAQPMAEVSARIHLTPELARDLNNKVSCYEGGEGSTTRCALSLSLQNETETIFSATAQNLKPMENMTIVVGFRPHTFAEYQPSWQEKLVASLIAAWQMLLVLGSIIAIVLIIWIAKRYHQVMRRAKGRGTIVPEYLPPKNVSVLLSAQVQRNATSDVTAQLIDLAVRHYLKIYQTKEKTMFSLGEYELEIAKDPSDLRTEEQRLLTDLFGGSKLDVGSRFNMKDLQKTRDIRKKLLESRKVLQLNARTYYSLFEREETVARQLSALGKLTTIVGIVTLSPPLLIVAIVAFSCAHFLWPLTEKGVLLKEYLEGLRIYISVAEVDRIKMLQSPEGAEKVGRKINGENPKQLVKLYERVLPYAVLFGIEKEWTKQLGAYYEAGAIQPDWYIGQGVFNAVVFSSALDSFSSQSSSYSSSSSASSGGSDGGGSSGGGGGGGGGGGW